MVGKARRCRRGKRCRSLWNQAVSPAWPITRRPLPVPGKSPDPWPAGPQPAELGLCISSASGLQNASARIAPSASWAIMNLPMSSPDCVSAPAGERPTNSKGGRPGGDPITLGHVHRPHGRQRQVEGGVGHTQGASGCAGRCSRRTVRQEIRWTISRPGAAPSWSSRGVPGGKMPPDGGSSPPLERHVLLGRR